MNIDASFKEKIPATGKGGRASVWNSTAGLVVSARACIELAKTTFSDR